MTVISIEQMPNNEKAIKVRGHDACALLYCRNLIKSIIPAYFRRYDRALRCWVVHPFGRAELYHFLSYADVFGPAEVRRADLLAALRAANAAYSEATQRLAA
jgi:hypothetical protein